ncbi:MAG: tRNA (guanosine(46)-N7)-methyltransferase TrmB [Gammaproteobacteria bacterium]|nr:MAG: tRNA (guanosine(46)-N7)-methyltransferase TrmB [Gammaproteobacteria bacterium]
MDSSPPRRIRSFVRRRGRLTQAQERALGELWSRFGVDVAAAMEPGYWDQAFAETGPLTLEVGFGMGQSLLAMAAAEPERRFVGVEVHEPGIGALLAGMEARQIGNIRVLAADVTEILATVFAPGVLDRVQIFFPDPWPKRRHHKRRLIQPEFVAMLAERVRPGGDLLLATDWTPYAEHMLAVLDAAPDWDNVAGPGAVVPRPALRPETRFEVRGLRRGHAVSDLHYRRV